MTSPVDGLEVEGQVAVQNSSDIRRVDLVPADAAAPPDAVHAIAEADQVVLAPGSLYTSLLPVLCVDRLRARSPPPARGWCRWRISARSRPRRPVSTRPTTCAPCVPTASRVDVFVYQQAGALVADDEQIRAWGVRPVAPEWLRERGLTHDPRRLAQALRALL